ncbi:MAG TPA: hypothetical protein VKP66_00725 [Steroidobacteraceae bacterium]|nr:hypothetical protein [Steroidobacteraceae bacterium]
MQNDPVDVVWRPRGPWEGCDLGVRLLQSWLRPVFVCYLAVALPLFCLFAATGAAVSWLPALLIWLSKPWLDRTILFVLSRALFGRPTSPLDVWHARADVWWRQLAAALTLRRLTASRSFTQPIIQLEGLRGAQLRARISLLAARHRGVARAATQAFALAEIAIFVSMIFLQVWLAPHTDANPWSDLQSVGRPGQAWVGTLEYAAVVCFLEPFYVAAGFGMYLNRRVELEAWDIEQEFRRAFAR